MTKASDQQPGKEQPSLGASNHLLIMYERLENT
jgi:hypothetical protein